MSTRVILLERLSRILDEVIDIDKVDAIPLKLNSRITFTYGDFEYGMVIENIGPENKNIFPKSFTLPQDMEGYYNFGFDMDKLEFYNNIAKSRGGRCLSAVLSHFNEHTII
jgi:hypothetical protein